MRAPRAFKHHQRSMDLLSCLLRTAFESFGWQTSSSASTCPRLAGATCARQVSTSRAPVRAGSARACTSRPIQKSVTIIGARRPRAKRAPSSRLRRAGTYHT
eukprot:6866852-Prymnesium_polylepis.2